jgi:hypothetical protein
VDDRDSLFVYDAGKESSHQSIGFDNVHAGVLGGNSTISVGENRQQGWSAHSKANHGAGVAETINSQHSINYIHDDDYIDAPIQSGRFDPGAG